MVPTRGLTFLPLALTSLYFFSQWYLPVIVEEEEEPVFDTEYKDGFSDDDDKNSLLEKEMDTGTDAYMTGWLTVSREYFIYPTGGSKNSLNPPSAEKNDSSIDQNESAYSSLYKLVNSSKASTADSSVSGNSTSGGGGGGGNDKKKGSSKLTKYFAVLRHGNLFLYTDSDQVNVKHVVVLSKHVVMMWPPRVTDGELFIKRSAICLAKLDQDLVYGATTPKDAFYLYSDSCSEKEDFYFALIRASKKADFERSRYCDPNIMAHPLHYKTSEILDLIQTLHSTDANLQTRWLNAILGRLFLSVKDTDRFENYFRNKIVNKLARVKRPNFLDDIQVKKINCGHDIPYFTHPRLKELTPEGLMTIEATVSYAGNFAVEVATRAVINLGARFKPRDVSLVLSLTVKSLEGKMVFKIKPPPSNRVWYAFESMPKLNLQVEPIVSSRQITYGMVTKAIENRFRETMKETLVLPNMDDLTFFGTYGEFYRGGIWDPSPRKSGDDKEESVHDEPEAEDSDSGGESYVDSPTLSEKPSTDFESIQEQYKQDRNMGVSKTAAALGTVKKWGNWYFKDKQNQNQQHQHSGLETTRDSKQDDEVFKPAPAAHNFPPELLNKVEDKKTPYGPAPEMKVPQKYPTPPPKPQHSIKRKPVASSASAVSVSSSSSSTEKSSAEKSSAEKSESQRRVSVVSLEKADGSPPREGIIFQSAKDPVKTDQ